MTSRRLFLSAAAAIAAGAMLPAKAYVLWHEDAFPEAQANIEALCRHPFITGLIDGTLKRECFLWYQCQNRHYLAGYERSLRTLAARMKDAANRRQLEAWAADTAATDAWTKDVIKEFSEGQSTTALEALRPTTRAYVEWEKEAAESAALPVAWAALLPCFWVYGEVGRFVAKNRRADSPYASWLAGYGDPAYDATVEKAVALADRLVSWNPKSRQRATAAFMKSVKMEAALWDAAVKLEA